MDLSTIFTLQQVADLATSLHITQAEAANILRRDLVETINRDHRDALIEQSHRDLMSLARQLKVERVASGRYDAPEYVAETAQMMRDQGYADPVGFDHETAIVEYRRVLAGRRLDRACEICSTDQQPADHSNRDHGAAVSRSVATALAASKR